MIEHAVRDLVDDSIETDGIVDIFKMAGIDRPDVSIVDDAFLQTWKYKPLENLHLKLLQRLLYYEITRSLRKNRSRARSFHDMLRATLENTTTG